MPARKLNSAKNLYSLVAVAEQNILDVSQVPKTNRRIISNLWMFNSKRLFPVVAPSVVPPRVSIFRIEYTISDSRNTGWSHLHQNKEETLANAH